MSVVPSRYIAVAAALFGLMLATWLAAEALRLPLLTSVELPHGVLGGALGVGLLVVDAVLPAPSSIVMVALGATQGAALGFALCLVGRVGGAAVGFGVGRRGGALMERLVPLDERACADAMLSRRGAAAIAFTRPVPLVSETIVVLAGASGMRWTSALGAALVGSVPEALVYSVAGSLAAGFEIAAGIWGAALIVAAIGWYVVALRRGGARHQPVISHAAKSGGAA